MAEYISKDRAKHFLCEHCNEVCPDEPCEPSECDWMHWIDREPEADVAQVRAGDWRWVTEDIYWCDNCGEMSHVKEVMGKPDWPYCPNCGAKMDLEATV